MKEKIEVSLIILGNVHSDFTLAPALTKVFSNLHKTKVPCMFLEEGPSEQTLAQVIESTSQGITQSHLLRQLIPELNVLYKPIQMGQFTVKYLDKSAYLEVRDIVKTKIMPLIGMNSEDDNLAEQIVLEFYRENAYREEIKLYEQLHRLNIPYAAIDLTNEVIMSGSANPTQFVENEAIRINAMVKNTFKKLAQMPQGGIIIISVGDTHAQRLAANIFLAHKNKTYSTENYQIHINPLSLSSSCVADWKTDQYGLEITRAADSNEIKEIYNILPIKEVTSVWSKDGFSIPILEELIYCFNNIHSTVPRNVSTYSLFEPSPHDSLVREIREFYKKNPHLKIDAVLEVIQRDRNYSLALRKLCALGDKNLIQILLNYSHQLPIDFHQTSSNGKTALAWLLDANISAEDKLLIKQMILEKMDSSGTLTQGPI